MNNYKLRDFFMQPNSVYSRLVVRRIVLGLAFFLLFTVSLSAEFISDKVSLAVGEVSDRDIVAPRTVSYTDSIKTKKLEEKVVNSIANVYDLDLGAAANAEENIANVFKITRNILVDKANVNDEQKADKLQKELAVSVPSAVVTALIHLDEQDLTKAEEQAKTISRKYFQRGIREDDLDLVKSQVIADIDQLKLNKNVATIVGGITQPLLRANFVLNVRETENRKKAALASLDPVQETVKKGQVLVSKGDHVTAEQIKMMEELGLYKGQANEKRILGITVFVLLVMLVTLGYLYRFARPVYDNDLQLVLIGSILFMSLWIGKCAHSLNSLNYDFVAPIAAGALLTAILIEARLGILISIILALFISIITEHDIRAVCCVLIGSMIGIYSLSKKDHGHSLTRTGIWIAAINFLVIASTGLIEQIDGMEILKEGGLGILSGIISAVITTGLLPYLENAFNITTAIKLLDLAKPNHPLLQRLLLDAPGTYHHSVLVGNLAETAAERIGADPVVVRVGAYYHDIGKIKRPYFFVENQEGMENPHDKIAPSLSTLIITSHIKDGLELSRDYKIPKIIMDIIAQHHGTTLVSYFYKRATENEHSECIVEADFRYEGPAPQTKEAALIMLADSCEAAVRSISKPNVNRIEATVRKIIREKLNEGQFDNCNLTLKDLDVIGDVFIRVLSSMFHTRIEYPDGIK
ncbi:MAG: HDIG domain-containing protein [Pelosinus sp.]|nr:HDIG domain-containing protein [Pelosinus sp.]